MNGREPSFDYRGYWRELHRRHAGTIQAVGHPSESTAYNQVIYERKLQVVSAMSRAWPAGRVLDAGCGIGVFTGFWADQGARVMHGCDLSWEAVAVCRQRCPEARLTQSIVSDLPYKSDAFDVVHCFDVLYHITDDEDWRRVVEELCRVTAPGGRLLILERWKGREVWTQPHVKFRAASAYLELLEPRRMQVVQTAPLYLVLSTHHLATLLLPRVALWAEGLLRLPAARGLAQAHIVELRKLD